MHRSIARQSDCTAGPFSAALHGVPGDDGRFAFPRALHNPCSRQPRAATGVAASGAREATVAALLILAAGHAVRVYEYSWRWKR